MESIFTLYPQWREKTEKIQDSNPQETDDKKAFMRYAKLRRLDDDDFEELEMQYDEYLIEQETED